MKYKELEIHASSCQLAADELAVKLINQERIFNAISIFQSRCDFNLFWLYQLYPEVFIHIESIEFLVKHIDKFKKKITIKQLSDYDHLITHNEVNSFEDFKSLVKT
jgi:hypothetical protein